MRQVIREVPGEEILTDIVDDGHQHCEKSEERYRLRVVSSAEFEGASGKMKNRILATKKDCLSSVKNYLDTVGATGSNPVPRTIFSIRTRRDFAGLIVSQASVYQACRLFFIFGNCVRL